MAPTPEQEQLINSQAIGVLATQRRDGGAQLTPINYAFEDGRFLVSTTKDRVKYHNVRRNPGVSLCIAGEGWRPYVTVYGTAVVEEEDIVPGTAAIMRRMGREAPDNLGDALREQRRILLIITPERFVP